MGVPVKTSLFDGVGEMLKTGKRLLRLSNLITNIVSQSAHGNRKITDEKLLNIFEDSEDPYLTASEIADELSVTRQAVHNRLQDLHERDVIDRKKTGRTVGWWAD